MNTAIYSAEVENTEDFHLARLLILLRALAGKNLNPVRGITKLAKVDFLVRYPKCLLKVLKDQNRKPEKAQLEAWEVETIESRMIRFRYGPWDERYRKWLSLLAAKGLVVVRKEGRSVLIELTPAGLTVGEQLANLEEFQSLSVRSRLVNTVFGSWGASKLKDYIYRLFPELLDMKWGDRIEL